MGQSGPSESSWNPDILAGAFDEAAWAELNAIANAAAGATLDRKRVVECVAALPWHTVTSAVLHGFAGVPKKHLVDALALAVRPTAQ